MECSAQGVTICDTNGRSLNVVFIMEKATEIISYFGRKELTLDYIPSDGFFQVEVGEKIEIQNSISEDAEVYTVKEKRWLFENTENEFRLTLKLIVEDESAE